MIRRRAMRRGAVYASVVIALTPIGTLLLAAVIAANLYLWGVGPAEELFWLVLTPVVTAYLLLDVYLWRMRASRGTSLPSIARAIATASSPPHKNEQGSRG